VSNLLLVMHLRVAAVRCCQAPSRVRARLWRLVVEGSLVGAATTEFAPATPIILAKDARCEGRQRACRAGALLMPGLECPAA
jgi:hypothetical protein